MTLEAIGIGECVQVADVTGDGPMRARLMDIGLTRNAAVTCLFEAPSGDPRAYGIRGAVIALRARDARRVCVTKGGESHGLFEDR